MSKNYMNDSQASEIIKFISDTMKLPLIGAGGGFAPIGTINFFDATVAPLGWLACDGSIHNISDYPDLATFYASQHGASNYYGGNGTTTFAVPNLQGEFLRGAGTNSHANQGDGANVGVHQDGTKHQAIALNANGNNAAISRIEGSLAPNNFPSTSTVDSYNQINGDAYWGVIKEGGTSGTGNVATFTSRPTNTSFLICVKATLSDAEINAFNVYTPREHQVAWWEEEIDGVWKRKPVYERTYKLTTFAPIDVSDLDAERIEIMSANIFQSTFSAPPYYTSSTDWWNMFVNYNDNGNTTLNIRGAGGAVTSFNRGEVTIRYTKSTDQWQTS